jgi:3D (Asp-Asp-Asp) domain-containing protein
VIRALLLLLLLTCAGAHEVAYPAPMRGRWVEVVLTAYSPLDRFTRNDEGNPRRLTATGVATGRVPYGVATDPQSLPYGTRIWIPPETGYLPETFPVERVFTVDDTGSIPRRRTRQTGTLHLDLRYKSVESAQRFGTRRAWVFVIEESE